MHKILLVGGALQEARSVELALHGSEVELQTFLCSNDLWGGAGSIADQSLLNDSAQRKHLEKALVQLGRSQIKTGAVNARTELWVNAFEKSARSN